MNAPIEAAVLLQQGLPQHLPTLIVEATESVAGSPVAVYVFDVDGSILHLLAGDAELFPERIRAPLAIGPELPLESLPALGQVLADVLPGSGWAPLLLGNRALGALISLSRPAVDLSGPAEQAALALELGSGYTDVVDATRRRRQTQAAAEIQQNLLPPRLARVEGADIAGGVLPGYDVGGDFFDYAQNADGLWLTIADAVGKGNQAAALASLAIGALRAARCAGATLEETAQMMHDSINDLALNFAYVTAVLAVWHAPTRCLRWLTCGHPRPLVLDPHGDVVELPGAVVPPLGLLEDGRSMRAAEQILPPGARLVLYSDGISERRLDGAGELFGREGIIRTLRACRHSTAAGTTRALQDAVLGASSESLRDDATLVVLALDAEESDASSYTG